MKLDWPIEIAGLGKAVPEHVITNADLEQRLDTSDEWILKRTGIRERRIADDGHTTLALATEAARAALQDAQLEPSDLDLIIVATITPEHTLPSTGCELQAALGCGWIPTFDLVAACSGFVYGLTNAAQHIHTGLARNALVVGVDCMTRMIDLEDRGTAILFGDGAAAAIIRKADDPQKCLLAAKAGADGGRAKLIYVPAGGVAEPASLRTVNERLHYTRMLGREVYKFAVTQMQTVVQETLDEGGVTADDVKLMVPHQSNLRIIESACEKLGFPRERVLVNIDRYGNTSAASVPIALVEARDEGRYGPGDLVLMVAFGAGLTWGSVLIRM